MTTDRRTFLRTTGSGLAALAGAPLLLTRRDHDLVLRGGTVHDGLGGPARVADVAVTGDRIVAIAPSITERGREEIDARGLVVAPGFIDIHSHGDGSLTRDPRAESVVHQGITTIVVGADGSSRVGIGDYFASIDALHPGCNVASMIGLGTLRGEVIGSVSRVASATEIERMRGMVAQALRDGACGASSGLEYTPGGFASTEELAAVCRPLADRGLCYATHMRNEDDRVLEAIEESMAVAEGAGCALHVSHLKMQGPRNWSRLDAAFAMLESANQRGMSVTFDRYPYVAYSTGLTSLFPIWSRDGGIEAMLRRVDDPATAERVHDAVLAKVELIGGWDNVQVTAVSGVGDRGVEGQRLGSYAASQGADPYQFTVGLFRRNGAGIGMVGFAMSEENLDRLFAHPLGMVCSDGGAFAVDGPTRRGTPHPRGIGSFPRVLGRYVRERKALTLEQAIYKMSGYPAARCQLTDRGRLAAGAFADVVVFDPATIADRATFADPYQYATGIRAVVVNGAVTLDGGARRGEGNGRAVRA
jgi:N-acyl-D-aspartate/D-glutamate deacylase